MKRKIFIVIGYGSIGKKHCNTLKKFNVDYYVISSQKNIKEKHIKYSEIKNINPDYVIIASPTSKHLLDLMTVDRLIKNKVILIEKPVFNKKTNFIPKNNKVFVAYNMRFHPIINYLKNLSKKNIIYNAEVYCGSYLPNWRKRSYIHTSSANKKLGGGVVNDLSHEIDYSGYIFGKLKKIFMYKDRISNLSINTEDYANIFCKSKKINILICLDYISKIEKRMIKVNYKKFTVEADLIKNKVYYASNNFKKTAHFKKIDTYNEQIKHMINNKFNNFCTFNEGVKVLEIIH